MSTSSALRSPAASCASSSEWPPRSKKLSFTPIFSRPSTSPKTRDRKSTRLNSSHDQISYAVFCLKKKKKNYKVLKGRQYRSVHSNAIIFWYQPSPPANATQRSPETSAILQALRHRPRTYLRTLQT